MSFPPLPDRAAPGRGTIVMTSSTAFAIAAVEAALAIGLTLVAVPARAAEPAKAPGTGAIVMAARAEKECFANSVRVTGFLVPRDDAVVMLDMPGYRVSEILAREGDKVSQDQNLVKLVRVSADGPGAQAQSPASLYLKAPAPGTVIKSTAVVGAVASPVPFPRPEPLFRIAVKNEIELEAEVPGIQVPLLAPNQPVRARTEDGRDLTGRVRLVGAEINQMNQLGKVRIAFDDIPSLRVGTFARATIEPEHSCSVSVPKSSVLHHTDGTSVQVIKDGVVKTLRVHIGLLNDLHAEIRDGLVVGDEVVATAGNSLRDGDHVRPVFAEDAN
jgi:multidrug efflux pump subunit AcrA (membrane-fusion protein)